MAHKVTIHDVVAVAREVEIPEVCPKCNTPLHHEEEPTVRQWELHDVQHVVRFTGADSTDDPGDGLEYRCDEDDGDSFTPIAYYCACGHCFTEGSLVVLDSDNPRSKPVLDIVGLES